MVVAAAAVAAAVEAVAVVGAVVALVKAVEVAVNVAFRVANAPILIVVVAKHGTACTFTRRGAARSMITPRTSSSHILVHH